MPLGEYSDEIVNAVDSGFYFGQELIKDIGYYVVNEGKTAEQKASMIGVSLAPVFLLVLAGAVDTAYAVATQLATDSSFTEDDKTHFLGLLASHLGIP